MSRPIDRALSSRARDRRDFALFAGPAVLLFGGLLMAPVAFMFAISLLEWPGLTKPWRFVGLENYARLLSDDFFWRAATNTVVHLVVGIAIIMPIAFLLGYFLAQRRPGNGAFRTVFFSPAMISVSAMAMIFVGVYLPDGILNSLLRGLGLEELTRNWLGDQSTALASIIAVDVWGGIGFYSVLFYASLSGISDELYEAARLDGAGPWSALRHIAVPLSRDFIGVLTMLLFVWILLGAAQNVLLLTRGGPGQFSLTLGYFLYSQAFAARNIGYSQAVGVCVFIIGAAGMVLIRVATRRSFA